MKNQVKKQEDIELRSVVLVRVGEPEKPGTPQDERNYAPKQGMAYSSIPELVEALYKSFDLIVLHDPVDGCLVLDLQEGSRGTVGTLDCLLHKKV